jgi:cyclic beta-1,2-glucan glucanotransferase
MPQNTHLEIMTAEAERLAEPDSGFWDSPSLRLKAEELAQSLPWLPSVRSSHTFGQRCRALREALKPVFRATRSPLPEEGGSDDFRWLYDNVRLLDTEMQGVAEEFKRLKRIPHVRNPEGTIVPRVMAVAEGFLLAVDYRFSEQEFNAFLEAFQATTVLELRELWGLVPALRLALLERIAVRGARAVTDPAGDHGVGVCIRSLRDTGQISWKELLEPLILFDHILREDPAECYAAMDFDSREFYRKKLSRIARHSDFSEIEVAREVVKLAREARRQTYADARVARRESHVGYYLLGAGKARLFERVGYRAPVLQRIQGWLRDHPDEFFLPGIEILTLIIMSAAVWALTDAYSAPILILLAMLVLLLPSSQSAVQLVNYLTTALLPAEILPKLDFSEGIPEDCTTLVAVPSLLLNSEQVHALVENLEVRFLGNHDPNLHFALLTDLPDAREPASEDSPLIDLCSSLISGLNEKYAERGMGSFFLLHRHRIFNPRERVWMGWERKRGKLLDLNNFLRGQFDSFPVKVGDVPVLAKVRYVITLDADTELPRGSARRMVGAMAHPMNRAIIDPEKNIVVAGYGILQPRVGVGVQSTARSRLAAIYAGETGLDIYTRAVSDAYQDLYGEGSFTGKGIYEVDAVYRVLSRRFPRNALLSHDLIEGAYARAGLASDIEVIEDYPSHYSAYNRRKHRWLRGDWQIVAWLFPKVRDESGARVPNPLTLISWWKIFDNIRRSLVEPATFVLLVFGWLAPVGSPLHWTVAALCILFLPVWFQLVFGLVRAAVKRKQQIAREALGAFYAANVYVFLNFIFLAHQMLLSVDAVVRALVRRMVTRERLLEWETAAQAELGAKTRAPVDTYLNWMPVLAVALGVLVELVRPSALAPALPILLLWACSKPVSSWLNQPSVPPRTEVSRKDVRFIRRAALRTWRYFAEFSNEEHHWLVPDNIQEEPPAIAARVSPTNLGLLLNARQVACEFGYLTLPEFADQTLRTLATVSNLRKYRGHLLNWYDTRTLQPLTPLFVSSVDNGNLLASLWTLQQGCRETLRRPLLQAKLREGLLDHLRVLAELRLLPRRRISALEKKLKGENWLLAALDLDETTFDTADGKSKYARTEDAAWFTEQARARVSAIRQIVGDYLPWLLPEFSSLRSNSSLGLPAAEGLAVEELPDFAAKLHERLKRAATAVSSEQAPLYARLCALLPEARQRIVRLVEDIRRSAAETGKLADEMDFGFLLNRRRKLMSIGFEVEQEKLHSACYDLLATESRTAIFAAIAKDDIPQESWFLLGRAHTLDEGRPVLLSWTGTMFEYLMPGLWLRSYSNTLLERSRAAAVRSQQAYAAKRHVPWGISESAFYKFDEAGNYQYYAFGLPHLALRKREVKAPVISPYSTFLALNIDPVAALRNLRQMADMGWSAAYGFYEAADYAASRRWSWRPRYQLVRCWMAHHQGMSLLSMANFLHDNVVQRWFHSDRRVQATELLLHEKPVAHVSRGGGAGRNAAA